MADGQVRTYSMEEETRRGARCMDVLVHVLYRPVHTRAVQYIVRGTENCWSQEPGPSTWCLSSSPYSTVST